MLIEFSVKNFLSFKNKITLSMEKGIGNENQDNVVSIGDIDLLKTAAIYGANASGKSNILKALTCSILMVRNSNLIPVGGKWNFIKPFLFDKTSKNKPSEFEFIFIENNIKYRYFFSADANRIYDEILDVYNSQKPSNIFTRIKTNNYEFTKDKNKLETLAANNTENKLFLSTATNWNYDKTKDAYLWFANAIDTYDSFENIADNDLIDYATSLKENVTTLVDNLELSNAIDKIFDLFRKCNKYIDDVTPWILVKDESKKGRLECILYNLLECIRIGSVLLQAFLPTTAERIFKQINTKETSFDTIEKFGNYESPNTVNTPEVLFARIEK